MGNGMVRKVDELGRVVIPKEMRRILNIKTGSSIEMFINDQNQVVLKKFSELENVNTFVEALVKTVYDCFNNACFVCDDEKVLSVCGLSKKEYLTKKVISDIKFKDAQKMFLSDIIEGFDEQKNCYVFSIICEGFESGKLVVIVDNLEEEKRVSIIVLLKFLCGLLNF